jgi:hypothetical protein
VRQDTKELKLIRDDCEEVSVITECGRLVSFTMILNVYTPSLTSLSQRGKGTQKIYKIVSGIHKSHTVTPYLIRGLEDELTDENP